MTVRVIALGSPMNRDDGAAMRAARALEGEAEVVLAGRPGPGLLDLLAPTTPTLLLDVVRRGLDPGSLIELDLAELASASVDDGAVSSHGLGPAQAFRLAEALGRELPPGCFLGIGGARFDPGDGLSPEVEAGLDALIEAARGAIAKLGG